MNCPNCNHEQPSGKFCGKCGAPLQEEAAASQHAQPEVAATTTSQMNATKSDNVARAKEVSSQYVSYFLNLLKQPSRAFTTTETHFTNGLISIIIYALALTLGLYFLANSLYNTMLGGFGEFGAANAPFFAIFSRLFFFVLLFTAGAMTSTLVMIKAMKEQMSFKALIAQFGSLLIPAAALSLVTFITGLLGLIQITLILGGLSLFFILYMFPALFIYEKASHTQTTNSIYWASGATLLSMFITFIIIRTGVFNMLDEVESLLSFW